MEDNLRTYYRNNMPHFTPIGGTFFITFRTKDSVPARVMQKLRFNYVKEVRQIKRKNLPVALVNLEIRKARYRYFQKYDKILDTSAKQNYPLADPEIIKIITDKLHELDGELYQLIAYCIMPNHVHLLISLANQIVDENDCLIDNEELALSYKPLCEIMRRIKGATSRYINLHLGLTGQPFWQKDSYDHYVRDAKSMENIWWYIVNNPVKAGLVLTFEDFPYTYWREIKPPADARATKSPPAPATQSSSAR
jgi:REP element-mobilizing transposase RayT